VLGGNQRETDRLKAQKKAANAKKPKESASSLAKVRSLFSRMLSADASICTSAKGSVSCPCYRLIDEAGGPSDVQ
jgi:hypothetical protein